MARYNPWPTEAGRIAYEMKAAGKTSSEISAATGIKTATVISHFWARGLGGGKPRGAHSARSREPEAPGDAYVVPTLRRFSWEAQ